MAPQSGEASGKRRSGATSRSGRSGRSRPTWAIAMGVIAALALALWAGVEMVRLAAPPVAEPSHDHIRDEDRERLVEILRQDEGREP